MEADRQKAHARLAGERSSWFPATRWFSIAIGLALVVATAYEIAGSVRLQDVHVERLLVLDRVRDVSIALILAVLTAWFILRKSPSLLGSSDPLGSENDSSLSEAQRVVHFTHWFIQMRWLAVIVAALLVFFAVRVVELLPAEVWWPLMITIFALAGLNVMYTALLRSGRVSAHLLPVQAYGDLVVLTVLLHFSGGVENTLATLMLFHVIIAGIVLPRRHCYIVAAAASVSFGLLVWAEWAHVIDHYTLRAFPHTAAIGAPVHAAHDATYALSGIAVQTAILFLTAYFTTTVTDRLRRRERQLAVYTDRILSQQQLLERALETTNTGLCVCDRDLQPAWTNARWLTWFGPRLGVCAGGATAVGISPGCKTFEDGEVRVTEVALDEADRDTTRQRFFQLTTAPLLDKDGVATHVVHLGQEITEQKRVREGLVRAAKLAAVGEIAGQVAHEVNNPIAIISAKARLLQGDPNASVSPKMSGELSKIADLADRVGRIAQGLLSYSRPSAGAATLLDLRVPIRKALANIQTPAAAAGVQIEEYLAEAIPEARGNGDEMEQVFLNLFLNSLDAMPRGGTLRVSASLDSNADNGARPCILVLVADTGCGIPANIRDRVFEPFVTTKESGKGTGLGLSICLGLTRSNGGDIDLESEPGRGTTVRLRFPVSGGNGVL